VTDDQKPAEIVRPIRWASLRTDEAERVIRERAKDQGKIIFGTHAFERIEQRSITQVDALNILKMGCVREEPQKLSGEGDWTVIVERRMPGGRMAGVVTIIFHPPSDTLFVKTVEWLDLKR